MFQRNARRLSEVLLYAGRFCVCATLLHIQAQTPPLQYSIGFSYRDYGGPRHTLTIYRNGHRLLVQTSSRTSYFDLIRQLKYSWNPDDPAGVCWVSSSQRDWELIDPFTFPFRRTIQAVDQLDQWGISSRTKDEVNGVPTTRVLWMSKDLTGTYWIEPLSGLPMKFEVSRRGMILHSQGLEKNHLFASEVKQYNPERPPESLFEKPASCSSPRVVAGQRRQFGFLLESATFPPVPTRLASCSVTIRVSNQFRGGYQISTGVPSQQSAMLRADTPAHSRNHELRLDNPPSSFRVSVLRDDGREASTLVYRNCLVPHIELWYEVPLANLQRVEPDSWNWVIPGRFGRISKPLP